MSQLESVRRPAFLKDKTGSASQYKNRPSANAICVPLWLGWTVSELAAEWH